MAKKNAACRASISVANAKIGGGTTKRKSVAPVSSVSEVEKAVPLLQAKSVVEGLVDWVVSRVKQPFGAKSESDQPKISLLALFSYSTNKERVLMFFGLIIAGFAGLCLPAWLVLLARSLDTFSNLANLGNAGLDIAEILQQQLNELIAAFAILGVISLVVGFLYVAIWTYTGEKQALRIKELYVHAALKQDAEFFDLNNRDELPTEIANSMIHIGGAVGRQTADLFANFVSAVGSLAVALVLNAPLALIMLCVVPVVGVVVMIVSCFLRKSSKEAGDSFISAGALATEVIAGIKTVASLCAEKWAVMTYDGHVTKGQERSVYSGFLTGLMTGLTGLLFYSTYVAAFVVGTEQVANDCK